MVVKSAIDQLEKDRKNKTTKLRSIHPWDFLTQTVLKLELVVCHMLEGDDMYEYLVDMVIVHTVYLFKVNLSVTPISLTKYLSCEIINTVPR